MSFSYATAKLLCDDKESAMHAKLLTRHIMLPWKYLGREAKGVRILLENELNCFVDDLGGAPVAYGKIWLKSNKTKVLLDQAWIHFDVIVECIYFEPKINAIMTGTVQAMPKRQHESRIITCLVHDVFPCHIFLPSHFRFDFKKQGDRIRFRIKRCECHGKIFSLRGEMVGDTETDDVGNVGFSSSSVRPDLIQSASIDKEIVLPNTYQAEENNDLLLEHDQTAARKALPKHNKRKYTDRIDAMPMNKKIKFEDT